MKDPIVIEPADFNLDDAWAECRDWVDKHEPGSAAAAAGADPGVVSCPKCGTHHWAWGRVQQCASCGFRYPVSWWSDYAKGCDDGRRVAEGGEPSGGVARRLQVSAYYRHGYEHYQQRSYDAARSHNWEGIAAANPSPLLNHIGYCERCGNDKEGRRARRTGLCVRCESETRCRHENRTGPYSLDTVCAAGIRLGDLIDGSPGWALRIPCGYHACNQAAKCDSFEPVQIDDVEREDSERDRAIAKTLTAMSVVSSIKAEHRGENWKGVVECPVCGGRLHVSHAASNGHVWGSCETKDCVAWME